MSDASNKRSADALRRENARLRHELDQTSARLQTEQRRMAVTLWFLFPAMTPEALGDHMRDTREYVATLEPDADGRYVCPGCDRRFAITPYELEAHILVCVGTQIYPAIPCL